MTKTPPPSGGLRDSTQIGISCTGALVESVLSGPEPTETGLRVFQSFRPVPVEHDDALTLAETLLTLRRFTTCSVPIDLGAPFERLTAQGHAEVTSDGPAWPGFRGYRVTTSGARLGKAVLQHIQVCTGTFERARPDGCMERLCCPRCGGDLDLLQREES